MGVREEATTEPEPILESVSEREDVKVELLVGTQGINHLERRWKRGECYLF